ncbi:hypothetical protein GCM10018793_51310 [Streptomyces sulfonofaciens]|uniref:DUF8017 domain-containing protein n=1 Tax=Streptomyces sulfonofaciens TaxID=68272 RepID=A0A919GI57_9ACTN|nr:hypothetical protein [Streptomyces sulfonofaciens]GHH85009.1 hypothetical protein GCM10018793_51310 [Streptomyces sulfonofaciens]
MWPGDQPPGGEQNPQNQSQNPYQQPGYQQPNPYTQPGYQQQNPYGRQPGQPPGQPQWSAPTVPMGAPRPPRDERRKTMITALVAAGAVVIAAGVTGFLVLGGHDDDTAAPAASKSPTASSPASPSPGDTAAGGDDNPRGTEGAKPTIPGWKVVVNPKWGTAFDVPPDWQVSSPTLITGFEDDKKGDGSPLITMSAPAFLKEKWCTSDDDHDGQPDDTALAAAGTKGQNGAKNTDDPARNDPAWWVFGGYTDQKDSDKKLLKVGEPKPYTTKSGVKGSVATTYSKGVPKKDKCDSDGKATTFAFKNAAGDFVSWTFYGAKGVKEEVPEATIQKILSTVRLNGQPEDDSAG